MKRARRTLLFGFFFFAVIPLFAQGQPSHRFLAGLQAPLSEDLEKILTEAMVGLEPSTRLHYDRARHEVEILSVVPLQQAQFAALLQQVSGPSLSFWQTLHPTGTMSSPMDIPGSPKFFDTGDPSADEARYEVAKLEWIQRNRPHTDATEQTPK